MNSENFFCELYLNEELSDVWIIAENKGMKWKFPAHSFVLKRTSPVFTKILESEFVEGSSKTITITDFKANHVEQFLKFLYTTTLPGSYDSLCELTKMAHKYMVPMERCEEDLLGLINFHNIYELFNLSELYSLMVLRGKCLSLIKCAAFHLLKFDEIEGLSEEMVIEIVSADNLNVSSEMEVFNAIWKWGSLNVSSGDGREISNENISEVCKDLLKHVRYSLLNKHDLGKIGSLGITVDDSDRQKEDQPRKPLKTDSQWILRQCDVLNLEDVSSSSNSVKFEIRNTEDKSLLRLVSLADAPFHVVGVLFAYQKEGYLHKLVCQCESVSCVSSLDESKYSKTPLDVICEFLKPIEVCKNQTLTVHLARNVTNYEVICSCLELKFDRNVIRGGKGRTVCLEAAVCGIKKLFLL